MAAVWYKIDVLDITLRQVVGTGGGTGVTEGICVIHYYSQGEGAVVLRLRHQRQYKKCQ